MSLHSQHSGNPHYVNHGFQHDDGGKPANGEGPHKKFSMTESMHEKLKLPLPDNIEKSWWFIFCKRCRQEEGAPSWEPPMWQRLCPYPFCPTYRQFARILSLFLIGLLCWGIVYAVLGKTAAPEGQLFGLAVLCIAAHFGGWLMSLTTLPALIGMLMVGILFQNVGLVHIEGEYNEVVTVLRKVALVIILTRAGLDLDPAALKRLRITVPKLGLVPWLVECVVVAVMTHYLMDLPWIWGFLLGSVIAAVSPAVVVSCLFRLRQKGYGMAKGIPTLIIAVSGIDDATSVAIFGIIHSIMFTSDTLVFQIIQGPLSIIGGIGFGILWGILAKYVPEKQDPFVVPLRILMLFGGGLIAVLGSESIGYGGAGPLGCITAAFVSCYFWSKQGWEIEDNPVATAFEIFWMIFEPILFGLTGTQIKINELDPHTVSIGISCLLAGIIIRIISTVFVAIGAKLNLKEKIFVSLSWMAKATVQAALGPVALDSVRDLNRPEEERDFAERVLVICVLSILLTAPVGAILITLSGPRLLKKTTTPVIVEGWRRSARPSLRDISIIDEDDNGETT
ncbi:sodium/hydrogen exchanger 9B2 [Zootermopsis nevadensis]|uniref:Mitochondrial sodium/hydrogen exchanger NHA2 n=3 Tax=Zootermopsis nevadensis TaxID=136037 RepID=A0A067R6R0_ZOONE|nr:sodium/hydrogen exchanger 9B2 [Zootermopsis nevadensis]KDR15092.1 Mitochondrial sodium/hydrogen exchanger NHA2 [Zootermopsis nevadensis]